MLDAALTYAERGVPVFPVWWIVNGRCACGKADCDSPGKHPIGAVVPNGVKDATTDPVTIRAWWTRHPHANLATPTSWCSVLDVDPRHGGDVTLAERERQHGPLPETAEVLTGGGGRHVYLAPVPGLGPSSGRVGVGLDIRSGADAYVLLPPSSHVSGGVYLDEILHPLFETPLAPMPAWLLALASPPSTNGASHGVGETDWAALLAGAPEGQRREIALKIAGHYLGKRLPQTEVVSILRGYAMQCVPPFPDRACREIVRDLVRRDAGKASATATPAVPIAEAAAAPADDGLALVALGDLLSESDDAPAWLVESRLPAGGLGLLAGKPKAGKSTLARVLAFAVARGEKFLGHATTRGPVIYLALEEKRSEVREHFRAMGATDADQIFTLFAAPDKRDALERRLKVEAQRRGAVLIIIDPLFKFLRVEDGNDYAIVTAAMAPLLQLARETGAHVLAVHHLGKGERNDGDAILGSTAIFAAVDTALLMKRTDRYRTLSSVQRYGEDLDEITLALDAETRAITAGPARREADEADCARAILDFLAQQRAAVVEAEIDIERRPQAWKPALRALVRAGRVARTGRGGKSDPFRYALAAARDPEPAAPASLVEVVL
jgi:hypothetical protein